jgi:hypothetical protein
MKLICIKEAVKRYYTKTKEPIPLDGFLKIGNEYTAVDEVKRDGVCFYELAECPPLNGIRRIFGCHLFAFISDIDETELVNEKEYAG